MVTILNGFEINKVIDMLNNIYNSGEISKSINFHKFDKESYCNRMQTSPNNQIYEPWQKNYNYDS